MDIQTLDWIFPFVVFAYGAVMTFVLNCQPLMELAERKFPPDLLRQLNGHRGLGLVCFCIGALWSLQHIWIAPI